MQNLWLLLPILYLVKECSSAQREICRMISFIDVIRFWGEDEFVDRCHELKYFLEKWSGNCKEIFYFNLK